MALECSKGTHRGRCNWKTAGPSPSCWLRLEFVLQKMIICQVLPFKCLPQYQGIVLGGIWRQSLHCCFLLYPQSALIIIETSVNEKQGVKRRSNKRNSKSMFLCLSSDFDLVQLWKATVTAYVSFPIVYLETPQIGYSVQQLRRCTRNQRGRCTRYSLVLGGYYRHVTREASSRYNHDALVCLSMTYIECVCTTC